MELQEMPSKNLTKVVSCGTLIMKEKKSFLTAKGGLAL